MPIVRRLVQFPGGPQLDLIDIKNEAGRTPIGEAELAGWYEGAWWLVGVMKLDSLLTPAAAEDDIGSGDEGLGDEQVDIEVEVEDAQGQISQISQMSINADGIGVSKSSESRDTNSAAP